MACRRSYAALSDPREQMGVARVFIGEPPRSAVASSSRNALLSSTQADGRTFAPTATVDQRTGRPEGCRWAPYKKRFAKSRKISSKPAYIHVAAPFGRCGWAQGLFGDMYCGTVDVHAPGLI